jgi:hypothetical protein
MISRENNLRDYSREKSESEKLRIGKVSDVTRCPANIVVSEKIKQK